MSISANHSDSARAREVLITAAMLYNWVACPHRVTMDLFGNPEERDPPSDFVELLWKRGLLHEKEIIAALKTPYLDLSGLSGEEKERRTLEAMDRGEPLIYGGRVRNGHLLGEPDLLRKEGRAYMAGDIKSGAGEEGSGTDARSKKHYAVQLGLYTDILQELGRLAARRAFVWDVHGREVPYDFDALYGKRPPRTLWQDYQETLADVLAVVSGAETTRPASAAVCKECHWYSRCVNTIKATDDLTMVAELGRRKRDSMLEHIGTVSELATANLESYINGEKTVFHGIGPSTLRRLQARARLLTDPNAVPYAISPITLPSADCELFFDVEVDPLRDICYLHGFVERHGADTSKEQFLFFFSEDLTAESERNAFAAAWAHIASRRPCTIYAYSKYERTTYRDLQKKYPDVCSPDQIEELFSSEQTVDLLEIVNESTEWPTWDRSIKSLATHLGFRWRDTHPSGAASIEWFHRWIETRNPDVRRRVVEYNEDDCRAMRVLRDALERLPPPRTTGIPKECAPTLRSVDKDAESDTTNRNT